MLHRLAERLLGNPARSQLAAYRVASAVWRVARVFLIASITAWLATPLSFTRAAILAAIVAGCEQTYRTIRPAYSTQIAHLVAIVAQAARLNTAATAPSATQSHVRIVPDGYVPPPATVTPPAPASAVAGTVFDEVDLPVFTPDATEVHA